ncbi:MAG TPA: TonB-dependent receptor plug domain-containing protein [Rhizomicrobium sp.]|nr:TonB-dependent receptor plug domain-containing protein [Rhizomicrobium sp.]
MHSKVWRVVLFALAIAATLAVPIWAGEGGASVTTYERSYFDPIRPKTALDMVNWLPGFTFSKGDADIRGFAASAGNVLIDGVRPADKQFTLDDVLNRIPADDVEKIEVIRGSAPGYEMLGQSEVANVVRKKVEATSVNLSASDKYYTNGPHAPSATLDFSRQFAGGRQLTAAVSASRYADLAEGDGPRTRTGATGAVLQNAFVNASGGGSTAFGYGVYETPLWLGKLRLNANLSWTDYFRDEADRVGAAVTTLHDHLGGVFGGQANMEIGAHFNREFADGLTNESLAVLRLSRQTYASTLTAPGGQQVFSERDAKGETILRTDLRKKFDAHWSAEASAEGDFNWLNTRSGFTYDGFPISLPNGAATVNEKRGEVAAHVTWSPMPDLQIEAALRAEASQIASRSDASQSKTLFYPKPRLAVTYSPYDGGQLRLRFEREVGQLDFSNFVASSQLSTGTVQAGNTSVVPQQQWVSEIAYEQRFRTIGTYDITYRHSLISDAVDRVPVYGAGGVFDAPGNIGGSRQDAVIAAVTVPLDPLGIAHAQIKGRATLLWSAVRDPTTGEKRRITEEKPMDLSADFRQDLPSWHAAWGAALTGNWTKSDFRFDEIDTYSNGGMLDLFVEYQPDAELSLRAELDNVFSNYSDRLVRIYSGPRNANGLNYADFRRLRMGPALTFSLRRAL